jgi:CBS domain-containing protein
MKIREILHGKGSQVYSIAPEQTVLDAVAQLNAHRIGALVVRDASGAVVGIITERDVLRECLHHSTELARRRVRDVMTANLIVCVVDDDVDYAMAIVTRNRVRHLPVLDGDRLAGLVSIGDLVKATLDETQHENRYLKDYIAAR